MNASQYTYGEASIEQSLGKVYDTEEEVPTDPRQILEIMSKEPIFDKYVYKTGENVKN